ncbi:vacuolar sorting protein DID4 [Pholiota molesta]|nr:vacuolar sorting protein DID4 [Pholiota molesta]
MPICRDMLCAKGCIAFTGYGEEIKGVAILLGTVSANLGKVHDGNTLRADVTPAERLRQHQRSLTKAQRELDRERSKLEQSEKKLIMDIKKSAKAGELNACKVMAKDLVRTRRYVHKFYQMRTQLQAVSLRIQTLRSNQQMAEAMRGATRRESSMMDMKEEMMSDTIDDVMDGEEDEEEEGDKILKEVLDEIGVNLSQQLTDAPTGIAATTSALANKQPVALGESAPAASSRPDISNVSPGTGGGGGDALRRG